MTGPQSISLDASRRGVASFVVTNTSGRSVVARLLPRGLDGTDSSWVSLVGDIERPLGVDATLTAEVAVEVPEDAPAGQHSMRLDVAVEEAPERVTTGQVVSFTVPEQTKRRFPAWIIAVLVIALVAIAAGAWLILRVFATDDPTNASPPAIAGTAEIGSELTVQPGAWDPADVTLLHRWQSCPGDADPADPQGCTDITVTADEESTVASGPSYVVGPDQEGARLRVVELAVVGDESDLEGGSDLGDLPQATAASGLTEVVPPAPPEPVVVPNVVGMSASTARAALAQAGLQPLWTTVGAGTSCDPVVEAQAPTGGQQVELGGAVAITTKTIPFKECFGEITIIPFITVPLTTGS